MNKGFGSQSQTAECASKQSNSRQEVASLQEIQAKLCDYVGEIPDPRVTRSQRHLLRDILVIAILAVIAGAEGWEDMENYGLAKQAWLSTFLELPHGIPSDDTFRRVFERIKPQALEKCLDKWLQTFLGSLQNEVIPIDGKTLRGSYDRNQQKSALHMVTAWASAQRLVLGQVKVAADSNEITAIPALLQLLDLTGAIITLDAMGTQTQIVELIRAQKADYIVTLKGNHPTLLAQVKQWFQDHRATKFTGVDYDYYTSIETGHHRTEKRQVWAIPLGCFGGLYLQEQWSGLQTIVVVERFRSLWNKTTHEIQFYLTSLPPDAQQLSQAIRNHWYIENQLHWTLDVTFNEDRSRIRAGYGPDNFALLRRLALNALNLETTLKRSLRQKRKRAAMNDDYMVTVLNAFCQA